METIFDQPNSKRAFLIDEWVHSKRHRTAAKMFLIDGDSEEEIAEVINRSPRQTQRILSKIVADLNKHV